MQGMHAANTAHVRTLRVLADRVGVLYYLCECMSLGVLQPLLYGTAHLFAWGVFASVALSFTPPSPHSPPRTGHSTVVSKVESWTGRIK